MNNKRQCQHQWRTFFNVVHMETGRHGWTIDCPFCQIESLQGEIAQRDKVIEQVRNLPRWDMDYLTYDAPVMSQSKRGKYVNAYELQALTEQDKQDLLMFGADEQALENSDE